ncbi:MAG: phosphocholine cytidylyltransferase family protein [Alicyclobacillus mali]|uniref:phosphocholine cytidylyltransferase family protein n=1 Tax=Alicyclobacillus mali (ex Roth et al. 2021) TaxID=1123961 RepID=UPI0023F3EFD0|nr:phosphocholine cytidylyltransferase family protein [Alicyclobacillus mali (ex Roth et al. 2021)]MCL6487392.1 phosphocholine cytidylyltransferase family protein [Alicyclobacillus mali (ex Roth et al. 2021)]
MKPTAIILAAGVSRRMRPLTDERPKCLLPVGPKAVIDWQFEALLKNGIHDVIMVVGYRKEMIHDYIRTHHPSFNVRFIENPAYESTNTLFSLSHALRDWSGDFFYMNADVVYDARVLERLVPGQDGGYLAVDKKQCRDEEVKVQVRSGQIVAIGKHLDPAACEGEFIGVAKFAGRFAERFRQNVLDLAVEGNEMQFFEYALDHLADKSGLVSVDVTGLPCVEIDFPEDCDYAVESVVPRLLAAQGAERDV